MSTRQWSAQQEAIFAWFERKRPGKNVSKNLVVRARAGTGKTTTIVEGMNRAPDERIAGFAFNSRIAKELKERVTSPRVEIATLHSLGYRNVRRYWERLSVEANTGDRAKALVEAVCPGNVPDAIKKLVAKLHSKAREIAPYATQPGELLDLAEQFECEPDESWADRGFDIGVIERFALKAMELAAAEKPVKTGIDFADMIYLPLRNKWLYPEYDLGVVDEAQDMTPAQLDLASGVVKPTGRICIVGDDRQAIYAFRGADAGSLDRLKAELNADELGLTVTYRCAKRIVERAAQLVPDFTAAASNPDGVIHTMPEHKLVERVALGDFVLSRTNAPLVSTAMALVRKRVRVKIAGRDIGASLSAAMKRLNARSIPELLQKIAAWRDREVERALANDREDKADKIRDTAATLEALADDARSVREVEERISMLFTDNGLGDKGVVTCSSVHRAKGLEADRVFVLKDTLYPEPKTKTPISDEVKSRRYREEQNIEYVAITRAKDTLVWVMSSSSAADTMVPTPTIALQADAVVGSSRCGALHTSGAQCVLAAGHDGNHQGVSGHLHKVWPPAAPVPVDVGKVGRQTVEASTLGLRPGEWPDRIQVNGAWFRQGPGYPAIGIIYFKEGNNGVALHVVND